MFQKVRSLAILFCLCLFLAACGSPDETTAAGTSERETTAPASTEDNTFTTETSPESAASPETGWTEAADPGASESESASQESPAAVPVLIRSGSFTGTTPLETNNQYHGGYYYSEQTEDGQTVILNCCFTSTRDGEEMADYMAACAAQISEGEIQDLSITESPEHTQRIGYPVSFLSWQTGQGEDTRQWDAFFFMTDTHTYLYAFDTAADMAPEMQEVWQEAFGQLSLVDLTA